MSVRIHRIWLGMMAAGLCLAVQAAAADTPSVEVTLKFRPVQKDVDYETVEPGEYGKCQVQVEKKGKMSGYVVLGPAGQILRRFTDSDGDGQVDQWRYYQHGIEVYRDIDTNRNNKADQMRWLNTGGTRWGIDANEDGRIDSWKVLSAEEASREAVRALVGGDEAAMRELLLTPDDAKALGIIPALTAKLRESASDAGKKMRAAMTNSKSINSQTKWMRFDALSPSLIPADEEKATRDLVVYENAMAIVDTKGQSSLVQIGELVRVGEVWKLTQVPVPIDGNTVRIAAGGVLMQPLIQQLSPGVTSPVAGTVSPEMQKLLDELQKVDAKVPPPNAPRAQQVEYTQQRLRVLTQLVSASETDEDRNQWLKQMVEGISIAAQTGIDPDWAKRLNAIEADVRKKSPASPLLSYIAFRRLLAEYNKRLQDTEPDKRQEVQKWWLEQLADFVKKYPDAEDAPDAMLQLAITEEFSGHMDESLEWYTRLVRQHKDTPSAVRAAGAIRRLDLKGKLLNFSGPGLNGGTVDLAKYRGQVVLVLFWATWCQPCTEDLPQLRALYQQYHDQGFEIVGVNIDATREPIKPYLTQHRVTWPQIYAPGGLEGEPATAFGIISLPTMFLVDQDGKVLNRAATVEDLKTSLPELLPSK